MCNVNKLHDLMTTLATKLKATIKWREVDYYIIIYGYSLKFGMSTIIHNNENTCTTPSQEKINNNNNNNNMYLKSSIQTSSIDYIKENIHITLNISSNIPIQ